MDREEARLSDEVCGSPCPSPVPGPDARLGAGGAMVEELVTVLGG